MNKFNYSILVFKNTWNIQTVIKSFFSKTVFAHHLIFLVLTINHMYN